MNYACTTQVPNRLFDELLRELTFAELKVLLAVNRATWGWVDGPNGKRRQRAWFTCSRMKTVTGLSKRAISTAIAALIHRRLLFVGDAWGQPLDHPRLRQGHTRLYYSLAFPQDDHRPRHGSASIAEVDQQRLPTIETNCTKNQSPIGCGRTTTGNGVIRDLLRGAMSPALWDRLNRQHEKTTGP